MRGRQRQHDIVLGRRRLQFEVELAAETLAQRQSPGPIDAAAEGRVDDELHAARFVEEALEDDRLPRRQTAERGGGGGQIVDELFGGGCADADFLGEPTPGGRSGGVGLEARRDFGAQARDGSRKLVGSARRLAEPEGNVRRLSLRVLDPDSPALDPLNAIGGVAELKDVARHALDGEILVHCADDVVLRLQQHLIIGGVRNRAARG